MAQRANKPRGGSSKDAIALLQKDHDEARKLLAKLEKARGAAPRETLFEKLRVALLAHAKVEEELFYPAFHEAARTKEDAKLFFEAAEEHHLVELVIAELEEGDANGDPYAAKAKVLKDLVEHHADEEESEMFPRAKKLLGKDELVELGARMEEREEQLKDELSGPKGAAKASRSGRKPRAMDRATGGDDERVERAAQGREGDEERDDSQE